MSSTSPKPDSTNRLTTGQFRGRLFIAGVCLVVLVTSFVYSPAAHERLIICPLRASVGIPCPGCGLTRSFCAISDGRFASAFHFHIFGPLLYLVTVLAVTSSLTEIFTRRPLPWWNAVFFSRPASYITCCSFITYHLIRLIAFFASGEFLPALSQSWAGRCVHLLAKLF